MRSVVKIDSGARLAEGRALTAATPWCPWLVEGSSLASVGVPSQASLPSSSPVGCPRQKAASMEPITECMQAAAPGEDRVRRGGDACWMSGPFGSLEVHTQRLLVHRLACDQARHAGCRGARGPPPAGGQASVAHLRWRRAPPPAGARGSALSPAQRPARCSACPPATGDVGHVQAGGAGGLRYAQPAWTLHSQAGRPARPAAGRDPVLPAREQHLSTGATAAPWHQPNI